MNNSLPKISADEAAEFIDHGNCVACSGFTAAGGVKLIPESIAKKADKLHKLGQPFKINLLTGASSSDHVDGALSRANAVNLRLPYQSNKDMRDAVNRGGIEYSDLHLSNYTQWINYKFLGNIDYALVEVADYTDDGELTLTMGVGATPTFCQQANHILLEHNTYHSSKIKGLHDIYELQNPPHRAPIPLLKPNDRIGTTTIKVDPRKIIGVVENHQSDNIENFKNISQIHKKIGQNVAKFFLEEMRAGRIPQEFLPIQSGVGNIANAVLKTMGEISEIPTFTVYSEVAQDAVIQLMNEGRVSFASACSLTITDEWVEHIYNNWNFYKEKLILRPEEITNSPEIIRRLGLITLNTVLEVDCFGNANSTHVLGSSIVNGIGGSGDFARNGYVSIFTLPSTAKNDTISSIVPFCSHIDHTEHDTQIIVTEYGVADLRGKSPEQRSKCIIDNCAHPDYKPLLRAYLDRIKNKHIAHDLSYAFSMYEAFQTTGDMRNCKF